MRLPALVAIFLLSALSLLPLSSTTSDENKDGKPDQWFHLENGNLSELDIDRNYDGNVDYVVLYDAKAREEREEVDFNYDGKMDDFYYYREGILQRQEIDSNFDGKIDIWIYLIEGIYIQRYERDTDFDGTVDVVKNFGD